VNDDDPVDLILAIVVLPALNTQAIWLLLISGE
jgi:hypothetical protein